MKGKNKGHRKTYFEWKGQSLSQFGAGSRRSNKKTQPKLELCMYWSTPVFQNLIHKISTVQRSMNCPSLLRPICRKGSHTQNEPAWMRPFLTVWGLVTKTEAETLYFHGPRASQRVVLSIGRHVGLVSRVNIALVMYLLCTCRVLVVYSPGSAAP